MIHSAPERTNSSTFEVSGGNLLPWLISLVGLISMYGLTFYDLFQGLWAGDQQGHGPIVLAISIWLLWQK